MTISPVQAERLADYYDIVQEHNPLLHLVAPCPPEEFAIRHILESLTLLEYLPQNVKFADVGTGAGLPSIPSLLVRQDLRALLIDTKEKKASFLNEALMRLALEDRAKVMNKQFSELDPGNCEFITCRALDKFTENAPRLARWARKRPLILFGGKSLEAALIGSRLKFTSRLLPMSEQRYLFLVKNDDA